MKLNIVCKLCNRELYSFRALGEQLVEIKSPYLLKNMLENVDDSEHYKYKCMLENNVKIITDCTEYINYVNETYGKQLLKDVKKVNRSGRK